MGAAKIRNLARTRIRAQTCVKTHVFGRPINATPRLGLMDVFIILHWGRNFPPLGGVIAWHRAIESLVSISNCVIYIIPLLLSYKYDDIVICDVVLRLTACSRVNLFVGGQLPFSHRRLPRHLSPAGFTLADSPPSPSPLLHSPLPPTFLLYHPLLCHPLFSSVTLSSATLPPLAALLL